MNQADLMKLAARTAVDRYLKSDSIVGLGTGRTSDFAIERISELIKEQKVTNVFGVATSNHTYEKAKELGIPLTSLDDIVERNRKIDLCIDGADAIDSNLNAIKGRGGALFGEMMVEQYAKEFVIIVDESKIAAEHLLAKCFVPIEIINSSHRSTSKFISNKFKESILEWSIRTNVDGSLYLTDNSNVIMDVLFKNTSAEELLRELKMVHGVVCVGLFLNMATKCLVAHRDNTVETLEK